MDTSLGNKRGAEILLKLNVMILCLCYVRDVPKERIPAVSGIGEDKKWRKGRKRVVLGAEVFNARTNSRNKIIFSNCSMFTWLSVSIESSSRVR